MMETNDVGCHDASNKMIRQDMVSLSELGSRKLGTFNHCFVITKDKCFLIDRNTKVS